MSRDAPGPGTAGFALAETLVAVLLLAVSLLGAAAALAEALRGQHLALLQTRAADLAADLGEALQPAPPPHDPALEILAWRQLAPLVLPQGTAVAQPEGDTIEARLQWIDVRAREVRELSVALPFATAP